MERKVEGNIDNVYEVYKACAATNPNGGTLYGGYFVDWETGYYLATEQAHVVDGRLVYRTPLKRAWSRESAQRIKTMEGIH